MPLFARVRHFAKSVLYLTVQLLKQNPVGVISIARQNRVALKTFLFLYSYFYIGCMACDLLHTQWLIFQVILLSSDVEINPGPETLDVCTLNLNSIAAHDFLRVSLIEAYNSVYNYDLIVIVETRLDSTVNKDSLAKDGYTFIQDSHPHNVKWDGVGLYIKDSLPSKNRSDLVTIPECIL